MAIAVVNMVYSYLLIASQGARLRLKKKELERQVRRRTKELRAEKQRADHLLYSLLPVDIAESLKRGNTPPNRKVDDCSILFADIVSFTSICARSTPQQVVDLLNRIYLTLDKIILEYEC